LTLASPKGGQPPLDPKSSEPDAQTAATERFNKDPAAQQALANTVRLGEVDAQRFDAVFYPGGHGPMWDLAEDPASISLIGKFLDSGKPVAAVCHAPGAFRHVKNGNDDPLVRGKRVTGFTNSEEEAVQLTEVVPFLVENMLKANGGIFSRGPDWQSHVVTDGLLITGQNPQSSEEAARALLALLKQSGAQAKH
jgi:putative intracellular protease/amidase